MSGPNRTMGIHRLLFVSDAAVADDVDRYRHYVDERLDAVLSHMHAIGADATGAAVRGSVLTIADAVSEFGPDHILIALHDSDHANWQERRLVEIADRYDAATIVMGSRGLTGLQSMLLGSVSSAIVHHADRPTLVIRQPTQRAVHSAH